MIPPSMLKLFSVLLVVTSCYASRLSYVIGGHDAEVGAWPWMGSLEYLGQPFCGCTLIHPQWVLTAAHCIQNGILPSGVVLGLHDLWDPSKGDPHHYTVSKVLVHERYMVGEGSFPNDIALVKLSSRVDVTNTYIDVIELATSEQDFTGQTGYVTGWGLTDIWDPKSDVQGSSEKSEVKSEPLQQAELKIHKNSHCGLRWGSHFQRDIQICAGINMQRGACDGDSGGPLVVHDGTKWRLLGVVSWVITGCKPTEPSVFTRVAAYRDWIETHMK